MPIAVQCSGCGKRFKAPDRGAGKRVPCPGCKTPIQIPAAAPQPASEPLEDDEYRLADEPAPRPLSFSAAVPLDAKLPAPLPKPTVPALPATPAALPQAGPLPAGPQAAGGPVEVAWVPPTTSSTPKWLRHLHWCLALAMIPLAVSVVVPGEPADRLIERLVRSVREAQGASTAQADPSAPSSDSAQTSTSPDPEAELEQMLEHSSLDELLAALPGRKLAGAFLARDSYFHWLFALVSVAAYMTFFVLLASDRSAKTWHLLGLGTFIATAGVFLLIVVQVLASIGVIGGRGIVGFILLVLALIGMSYAMALDPEIGFVGSFFGFTFGVGLCEELCKALPLLLYYRIGNQQTWRGAFLWGLACGAGFGVSEGIMYSQDFYNGISGPGIYVVRFVSCVALHAVWSGSVGISIHQKQELLQDEWWMFGLGTLWAIAVPMVLHGLYDTMLKKEMELLALVVAAASFGYLAFVVTRLRHSDDEDERAAYVSRFIRSRAAVVRQS